MGVLSEDVKRRIQAYIPRYPRKQAVTLPALHIVHDEYRMVSNDAIVEIAELLDLHPAEVQDTMTFYAFFKGDGEKLGETRLWVCRGLACMNSSSIARRNSMCIADRRPKMARSPWSSRNASARARGRQRA
jgi:NADH:ubiquinone oxidoreductase subunit E